MNTFISADWTQGKLLGSGTFGNVYQCCKDGKQIAIKKFENDDDDEITLRDQIVCEIVCLRLLQFQDADYRDFLIAVEISKDNISMALELADGTLEDYAATLNQTERIQKCPNVLNLAIKNMHHIHNLGIIHADVKAKNILVWWKEKFRILIVDFSLSSSSPDKGECVYSCDHGAPEVHEYGKRATKSSDIWALGMSIITFLTKRPWEQREIPWYIVEETSCSETIKMMMSDIPSERLVVYKDFKEEVFLPERQWNVIDDEMWIEWMTRKVEKLKWKKEALVMSIDIFARVGVFDKKHAIVALSFAGDWCRDSWQYEFDEEVDFDLKREIFMQLRGFIYIPGVDNIATIEQLKIGSFEEMVASCKKTVQNYDVSKTPTSNWMKTKEEIAREEQQQKEREERAERIQLEKQKEKNEPPVDQSRSTRSDGEVPGFGQSVIPSLRSLVHPQDQLMFYCLQNDLKQVKTRLITDDPTYLNCIAIETAMLHRNYVIMKELLSHEKVNAPLANEWVKRVANELGDRKAIQLLAGCKSTLISKTNFATQMMLF